MNRFPFLATLIAALTLAACQPRSLQMSGSALSLSSPGGQL